ncbi:putative endonucleases [Klebsormidium nitens]|uniref:Putative endonucleases n=1 Tax=Klebsormidium nitens TaxID=105231 RepID=A0A1Y1IM54_KLENI|nr:putative endonucleases [Klebsormidium nitens]|eukprot:GAQ90529.1 putative endonucleases [Klebsormidium nitens]
MHFDVQAIDVSQLEGWQDSKKNDGPEQFVCDFAGCSKTFTGKGYLRRHLSSHSEQNAPPASYEGWRQHHEYVHIYGLPDGRVWSCEAGRFLKGTKLNGYIVLRIDGKRIQRHRLNFEIAYGRAILPGMDVDHIVPSPIPEDGSEQSPQDDSWCNLQELSRLEHNRKTLKDNPGAGKKRSVTRGFPVIARHVASGREVRYVSVSAAASTLGLVREPVSRRIQRGSSVEYGGHVFRRCPEHVAEQEDMPGEEWKDAKLHGRLLRGTKVSNLGRVQLCDGRRTEGRIEHGRHRVGLQVDGHRKDVFVYVLIAHTFIGPPPSDKHTVDHIDGNCCHNVIGNLHWATVEEQTRNTKRNRAVRKHNLQGTLLQTYGTVAEAAEKNDVSYGRVHYAATTGSTDTGFRWEFVKRVT